MDSLLKVLSTYELFVNLFPGVIFIGLAPESFQRMIEKDNAIIFLCISYFIGVIINRISSLVLEWLLVSKIKVVKYAPYRDYLNAEAIERSRNEHKLDELTRINNLYRALASLCICLIMVHGYYDTPWSYLFISNSCILDSLFCTFVWNNKFYWMLLLIFIKAFSKQTGYIRARVEAYLEKGEKTK